MAAMTMCGNERHLKARFRAHKENALSYEINRRCASVAAIQMVMHRFVRSSLLFSPPRA